MAGDVGGCKLVTSQRATASNRPAASCRAPPAWAHRQACSGAAEQCSPAVSSTTSAPVSKIAMLSPTLATVSVSPFTTAAVSVHPVAGQAGRQAGRRIETGRVCCGGGSSTTAGSPAPAPLHTGAGASHPLQASPLTRLEEVSADGVVCGHKGAGQGLQYRGVAGGPAPQLLLQLHGQHEAGVPRCCLAVVAVGHGVQRDARGKGMALLHHRHVLQGVARGGTGGGVSGGVWAARSTAPPTSYCSARPHTVPPLSPLRMPRASSRCLPFGGGDFWGLPARALPCTSAAAPPSSQIRAWQAVCHRQKKGAALSDSSQPPTGRPAALLLPRVACLAREGPEPGKERRGEATGRPKAMAVPAGAGCATCTCAVSEGCP